MGCNNSCGNVSVQTIQGPIGPQGPQGIAGTNGTNGSDGTTVLQVIETQSAVVFNLGDDLTVDYLTIPAASLEVGGKLEVTLIVQVSNFTMSGLFPQVQFSSSFSNTQPNVGGAIQSPVIFSGPLDSPKGDDIFYTKFNITRLDASDISIEGTYRLNPAPSSGVTTLTTNVNRTIFSEVLGYSENLDDPLYVSANITTVDTSLNATLLFASVELKKPV